MNISYNLEACIVTFLEVKESGEPQFMKRSSTQREELNSLSLTL